MAGAMLADWNAGYVAPGRCHCAAVDARRRSKAAPVAAPYAVGLEPRRAERQAASLLEASVKLGLHVVGGRHADLAAIEGPPSQNIGHVLASAA